MTVSISGHERATLLYLLTKLEEARSSIRALVVQEQAKTNDPHTLSQLDGADAQVAHAIELTRATIAQ